MVQSIKMESPNLTWSFIRKIIGKMMPIKKIDSGLEPKISEPKNCEATLASKQGRPQDEHVKMAILWGFQPANFMVFPRKVRTKNARLPSVCRSNTCCKIRIFFSSPIPSHKVVRWCRPVINWLHSL